MGSKKNIKVYESPDDLARGAADCIIKLGREAIVAKGRFSLVLSGGGTPEKLFKLLAQEEYKNALDWTKVSIWWGDERCVALGDDSNNAHVAKKLWLDQSSVPAENTYRIASDLAPEEAATLYEHDIRQYFGVEKTEFDLILLGMGDDGHTASLFPLTTVVNDTTHLVAAVYVEKVEMNRITMTASLINMSHQVIFLIAGKGKAEIIHKVLNGEPDYDRYPSQMINPHSGGLSFYIDREAGALLS